MISGSTMRTALACCAVAVLGACSERSAGDAVVSATRYLEKGDAAAAAIELKSALQQNPNQAQARYLLGSALLIQGRHVEALLELNKARELGMDDEQLAPQIARAWLATSRLKEVVQAYGDTHFRTSETQSDVKTAVAVAYLRLHQISKAEGEVSAALQANPRNAWALVTKARLLIDNRRHDEAMALVDRALAVDPRNGEAHLMRGSVLRFAKSDVDGAIKAYEKAAEDQKEQVSARAALIDIYLGQGKIDAAKAQVAALYKSLGSNPMSVYLDAVVAYTQGDHARAEVLTDSLLRVSPSNPQFLVLGGMSSLQLGHLLAAETKLGRVVQTVEGMTTARRMLAQTYLQMGQSEKALATVKPLLDQEPADAEALTLAAQAQLQGGNVVEAERLFAAAVRVRPQDVAAQTALALTDLARGNADSALSSLRALAARETGSQPDMALISAHLRRQEFDDALRAIEVLERKPGAKVPAAHLRGLALSGKGDLAGARTSFDAALAIDPGYFAATAALVMLDVQESKLDAARKRLDQVVSKDPRQTAARMMRLDVMRQQGATNESLLAEIDQSIKLSPSQAGPYLVKLAHLSRTGDTRAAVLAAQNALVVLPQDSEVLDAAGRALMVGGEAQQAISAYNRLASVHPRSPIPYLRLSELYSLRGEASAVASSLRRAFDVAPESPEVHRALLNQAVRSRDHSLLLAVAGELQRRFPESASGYLLRGESEAARKNWPAAIAAFRMAIPKKGLPGRAPVALYLAMKAAGDRQGAEQFAADWLKARPEDVGLRELMAGEAMAAGRYAMAEQQYTAILAVQPRSVLATNNLAWLLAKQGKPGAVEMAQRALAATPNAAPVLDTLAQALAAEGQLGKAIDVQRQAVTAMPDRLEYRLNLARLYVKAGQASNAERELQALAKAGDGFRFQAEVASLQKQLP